MERKQGGDRVLIISDAWLPQNNAIVRSIMAARDALITSGYQVEILAADAKQGTTIALPFNGGRRLELFGRTRAARAIKHFKPDIIHIATAGPLGEAARAVCLEQDRRFTTACHTSMPEALARRFSLLRGWIDRLALALAYRALRRFHSAASAVMASSDRIARHLRAHGVAPDRIITLPTETLEAYGAAFIAAMTADKTPLRPSFFKGLLYDVLIGWPLALLQWIPGLWLWQWGGKYLASGALRLRERRMNRPKLDDFE